MAQALPQPTYGRACRRGCPPGGASTSWKLWLTKWRGKKPATAPISRSSAAFRPGAGAISSRPAQWALRATEADGDNAKAFHVLAMALERMGHLHKALVTYERAFELDPEDPELLINLGLTAWNLKLTEGAAKMFQLYIAACPDSAIPN